VPRVSLGHSVTKEYQYRDPVLQVEVGRKDDNFCSEKKNITVESKEMKTGLCNPQEWTLQRGDYLCSLHQTF
jgi:hypothetical protein